MGIGGEFGSGPGPVVKEGQRVRATTPAVPAVDEPTAFACTPCDEEGGFPSVIRLPPEAWARFCEVAGLDPQTGAPAPHPLPPQVCPSPLEGL